MADGTYERRGPREAELRRLQRLIEGVRSRKVPSVPGGSKASRGAGSGDSQDLETFTDAVIARLNASREHLVFILWGASAQKKGRVIDRERHLVLCSAHPSPLSAYHGFFWLRPL